MHNYSKAFQQRLKNSTELTNATMTTNMMANMCKTYEMLLQHRQCTLFSSFFSLAKEGGAE